MTQFVDKTYIIFNNPFLLAPVLISFFKNCSSVENNLLLSYLVFPMTLSKEGQKVLLRLTKKSTLLNLMKDNKILLFRVNASLDDYRQLTNNCIQYCIDNHYLVLHDNKVTISEDIDTKFTSSSLTEAIKAASKLGSLLSQYEVATIYKFLGVRKL